MTPSEAAVILSAAAAYDNRVVTEVTAREWAIALDGLGFDECLAAVRLFFRTSTGGYLMPGHVRERVRMIRFNAAAEAAKNRGLPGPSPATNGARAEAIAQVRETLAQRKKVDG